MSNFISIIYCIVGSELLVGFNFREYIGMHLECSPVQFSQMIASMPVCARMHMQVFYIRDLIFVDGQLTTKARTLKKIHTITML